MINQEIPTNKCIEANLSLCLPNSRQYSDPIKNYLSFSEHDFINWCSLMTIDQLETCFRVYYPEAVSFLRKSYQENSRNWELFFPESLNLDASLRNFAINTYKKFTQALLFLSSKEYLDTITFNSDCFLFPNKVYKLLQNIRMMIQMLTLSPSMQQIMESEDSTRFWSSETQTNSMRSFQLLGSIVDKIQKNLQDKMKLKSKSKSKNQADFEAVLSQFNLYWKYCSEEEKQSLWFLGYNDIKKAAPKLIDVQYRLDLHEIEDFVLLSQKSSVKQLTQRIFSWKLGRNDHGITDYMTLIFKQLKKRAHKSSLFYSPKHKAKRSKRRKINTRLLRRSSLDESSNQTNQTDIQVEYERPLECEVDININQIIDRRIEKEIQNLADSINENANLYYDSRVQAYQRLVHALQLISVKTKVYGSCCVGLAVQDSDVDVTVLEEVLERCYGYLPDTLDRISAFFEYLQTYLINFPWISNLKVIKSATIPIIKFTIDNNMPYTNPYTLCIPQKLSSNIENASKVQIDLTVQTTQSSRKHLGIVSTKQTKDWLDQIECLQNIAIILKNQLSQRKLNQTYFGGLNTYTLLVLIVSLIRKEKLQNQLKISTIFERVLKFYSSEFEEEKYGIDLTNPQIFYLKPRQQTTQPQLHPQQKLRQLQIRDPQCPSRIMTRNCYQFKQIKRIFGDLHKKYFIQRRRKIEQICSAWNPKQNMFDQEKLMDWVEKNIEDKYQSEVLCQYQYSGQYQGEEGRKNISWRIGITLSTMDNG